ncbi:hypothetical protein PEC301653_04500 [Pectobacterium carotovorum subsp. carotovorum]|nr:hypothetical protein PCC21_006370 [Pectobacterium carotovorum subsp. carotovorum PCC21]GKV97404.1 hypothetical protein PEC301653_04500 [Pectobacterium carotovorum subsp. carotovorum]
MINLKVSLPLVLLKRSLIVVLGWDIFPLPISTHIFLSIEIKIILN